MNKEKFEIPIPDESIIKEQIEQIVSAGVKKKESFFCFMKDMYKQVGLKNLFSDGSELFFILITTITALIIFIIKPEQVVGQVDGIYSFIFLISPMLFLFLSIFTYANKVTQGTFDVEMVCKYNVFQIIVFRMLAFSVIAVLFNTTTIFFMAKEYEGIHFFRAVLVSVSGLFTFSLLFLYVMMKGRTLFFAILTICGWIAGNLILRFIDNQLYLDILVNMPLSIYVLVISGIFYFYLKSLNRLLHFKYREGSV